MTQEIKMININKSLDKNMGLLLDFPVVLNLDLRRIGYGVQELFARHQRHCNYS